MRRLRETGLVGWDTEDVEKRRLFIAGERSDSRLDRRRVERREERREDVAREERREDAAREERREATEERREEEREEGEVGECIAGFLGGADSWWEGEELG